VLGPISEPVLLPGGASKEAWAVDAGGERLLVRRAAGGVIHRHTLSLRHEFEVLEAAHEAGVTVPRPVAYIEDLDGREAFVMERLAGETIGRRIVRMEVPERLPLEMAEQLAKIHAIPRGRLPFLEEAQIERMIEEFADSYGLIEDTLTEDERTAAEHLAANKYATDDWTYAIP